jgi:predicted molibdopterin-dependent oxidoreductase YjgC
MIQKLTTCTFCGVGCGIYLESAGNRILGAYPSMSHPTNEGRICVRGWHVHEVAGSPDRLTKPLIKRGGSFEEATWEQAIAFVTDRLLEIRRRSGPDAIAFLNSPRCSNEESYLLQKLARAVVGTNNVDHGAGVYGNNSLNVLLEMIGVPAATNSIAELARSDVIVVDGVDLCRQLPTIAGWVIRASLKGARVMVIDTRRHRLAENADWFLQIKPGTEAMIYGAMAKVILDRGLVNLPFIKARCCGYEAFEKEVGNYDLKRAADGCGLTVEQIEQAALAYARARAAAVLYSTGVEARDTAAIQALVNLVLLTGQIGREGAGLYPLAEQNNLQGVCDMGMLPDRLPGYRPVADAAARRPFEKLWNAALPSSPGLSSEQVLRDRGEDRIQALWLCRYDPASTAVFGNAIESLDQFEFIVTQHLFMTEAAQYADVILPLCAFGEERVTFTSTERRIQLAERVIEPMTGTFPAWQQFAQLGRAMGAGWNYRSASDVMDEIGCAVPFYCGANYENLARDYGRQWPCTADRPLGTPRLLVDEDAARRLQFVALPQQRSAPAPAELPFTLFFGRSLYYWHQNVLVQHSETLKREYRLLLLDYPDGFVEINPEDAQRLQIRDGQKIRLRGASGEALSTARVTTEVRSGSIFVPYFVHQVEEELHANGSRQVAVNLEKAA